MGDQKVYIKLDIGDYMKDTRHLTLEEKGAWTECLWPMHLNPIRGILEGTWQDIALRIGCDVFKAKQIVSILSAKNVCDLLVISADENPAKETIQIRNRRMFREYLVSLKRKKAGALGAEARLSKDAATVEEIEETILLSSNDDMKEGGDKGGEGRGPGEGRGGRRWGNKTILPPTIEEVELYFYENGYRKDVAQKAWKYYNASDWHDQNDKQVKNWKQKMISVWFKDDNKIKDSEANVDNPNGFPLTPERKFIERLARENYQLLMNHAYPFWRKRGWKLGKDGSWKKEK